MRRYHQAKFGCKRTITSEDIYSRNSHIFYYIYKLNFHCDLTLMIATHFFPMTLQLIIMHDHTKFGYTRSSGSEDIFWTKPGRTGC